MSTAATPAIPATTTGNAFQFTSHSGHVKVSYNLDPNGPPRQGNPIQAPTLSYNGPEGQLSFSGSQIALADTPMGTLVSVVLKQSDAGTTTFSLFLPPVNVVTGSSQSFNTYAVKTSADNSPVSIGSPLAYDVHPYKGVAETIRFHAL